MSEKVRIELRPLGKTFEVERGTPLQDVLFSYGVEFPCGGHGRCKACRVKVIGGHLAPAADEEHILTAEEIAQGWRLACRARAEESVVLEIAQWEAAILSDESKFDFVPREGQGIAVDLGTTTLVAQLVDLQTGRVLSVRTALNPQVAYGADVMSRVQLALEREGRQKLETLIRGRIGALIGELGPGPSLRDVVIVGNTVMHHLFCGIDVEPLSHYPFEPPDDGLKVFTPAQLGWRLAESVRVRFLPCLGGFVGSDILAGILATRMHESPATFGLLDLGTNGEIVFGNRERLVCASTAAGPAFEGGRISTGMRASTGAIVEVTARDGRLDCHVLGGGKPRGICGSGLVDAVAVGLELGLVRSNGRLANGSRVLTVADPVALTQADIRELQLAKGAIAAGVRIVLRRCGAATEDVGRLYLAGAFGNYINRGSARRIGLIGYSDDLVHPAGNTALLGAKLALFADEFPDIRSRTEHISLASDAEFQDVYVEEMLFPPS